MSTKKPTTSATAQRPLEPLRSRRQALLEQLTEVGFVIRGSILERFSRCGSPGCACHADPPRLHGPYWQWTAKIKGKTVTRNLTQQQVARYREWVDNAQRLDQIVQQLHELSAQADAILRSQERDSAPRPKPQKASRARRS